MISTPSSAIPVIAIDGPTASGKGTVAQLVATKLGFHYLDSGALYRLTALSALYRGIAIDDEQAVAKSVETLNCGFKDGDIFLDRENVTMSIRAEEVGNTASKSLLCLQCARPWSICSCASVRRRA